MIPRDDRHFIVMMVAALLLLLVDAGVIGAALVTVVGR